MIDPPPPTFDDVRDLLSQNCVACHQQEGPPPFALTKSTDYRRRSGFIRALIQEDRMPPHLVASERWSDQDKNLVLRWLAAASRDEESQTVPAPKGEPFRRDRTFRIPEGFVIPSEGGERWHRGDRDIRTFRLAPRADEVLRVQAWRFQSSAPREVESVGLVHDDGTIARYGDLQEPNTPGYEMTGDMGWRPAGMLGILGVANSTFRVPEGFHFEIPKDHEIDFELRFRPSGMKKAFAATLDAELVNNQQPSRALQLIPLSIRSWRAMSGECGILEKRWVSPMDLDIPLVSVRAGRRIKSVSLSVDGKRIFEISDWDPHWQETWKLPSLRIAQGTQVVATFNVDNSEENPRNPETPPRDIQFGRRTGALGVWLHAAAVNPDDLSRLQRIHREIFEAQQADQVKRLRKVQQNSRTPSQQPER